jgi:hypothetical protein
MTTHDYLKEAESAMTTFLPSDIKFTRDALAKGIEVEYEHGTINTITNITNDDPTMTAKIAAAHLYEDPYYYNGLEMMEEAPYEYWKTHDESYWQHRIIGLLLIVVLIIIFIGSIWYASVYSETQPTSMIVSCLLGATCALGAFDMFM